MIASHLEDGLPAIGSQALGTCYLTA